MHSLVIYKIEKGGVELQILVVTLCYASIRNKKLIKENR